MSSAFQLPQGGRPSQGGRLCPECNELFGDGLGCRLCADVTGEGVAAPGNFWNSYVAAAAQHAEEVATSAQPPQKQIATRLDRAKEIVRENVCDLDMTVEESLASAREEFESSGGVALVEDEWRRVSEYAKELFDALKQAGT